MKRKKLVKMGLVLVLTVTLCMQSSPAFAEVVSFSSEEGDASVTEEEPELAEKKEDAEEVNPVEDVLSEDFLTEEISDDANAESEEDAAKEAGDDIFSSGVSECVAESNLYESAQTVGEGKIRYAAGLTWRLESSGSDGSLSLCIEGEGTLPNSLEYLYEGETLSLFGFSITSLVIGPEVSGELDPAALGIDNYEKLQSLIIEDRAEDCSLLLDLTLWKNCTSMQELIIGNGTEITSMEKGTFEGWKCLKKVKIPDSVKVIEEDTFCDCTSLEEVVLPDSVEKIEKSAFNGCTSLKEAVIPNNLKTIGDYVFYDCKSLKEVIIPDSVVSIGAGAFNHCTSLTKVVLGKNVTELADRTFYGCASLTDITIPDKVTSIGYYVFKGISSEAKLFIPNSVTSINYISDLPSCTVTMPCRFALEEDTYKREGYSFYHMHGENDHDEEHCTVCQRTGTCGTDATYTMTLSGKMTISGSGAATTPDLDAAEAGEVTSLVVEDGISSMDFSFESFTNLESVIISEDNSNYTSEDGVVFSKDGTRLVYYPPNQQDEKYVIADAVTQIEAGAFSGCTDLTTVHYLGTAEQWTQISIGEQNECLKEADVHYCTLVSDNIPTCSQEYAGTRVYSCAACGITFDVKVPKTSHDYSDWKVTREATCTQEGEETSVCRVCGIEEHRPTEKLEHPYSCTCEAATVLAPAARIERCTVCGYEKKTEYGSPLSPTISLNAKSITLQVKQATTCVKVGNLAKGDAVKSWKSSNTKIAKVTSSGKIVAQKKTGKAKVTVTLLSGKKATITVKVQKNAVKTRGMSISASSKVTLKVKKKLALAPTVYPITSTQKIIYTSSNKKVATVSKSGVVTAKKKGKAVITVRSGSVRRSVRVVISG